MYNHFNVAENEDFFLNVTYLYKLYFSGIIIHVVIRSDKITTLPMLLVQEEQTNLVSAYILRLQESMVPAIGSSLKHLNRP